MNLKTFIFAFLFLVTQFSFASSQGRDESNSKRFNQLFRFVAKHAITRDVALYTLLANRCSRYVSFPEKLDCKFAVGEEIALLDYDIHFPDARLEQDKWNMDSFFFIAFKKTLIETLSSKKTTEYLTLLSQGLSDFLTEANPNFNIWEMSVNFYNSKLIAARTIAALFQDTSLVKLHLGYLAKTHPHGSEVFQNNMEYLSMAIDTINMILDFNEDYYRTLFYPKSLQAKLKRSIYHFYVPLYLSMELKARGYSTRSAIHAPMMLTLTYEFITSASDYRYLFKDPEYLDPASSSSIFDIFAGFSGATFGVDKSFPLLTIPQLQKSFARSTKEGVSLLLQSVN